MTSRVTAMADHRVVQHQGDLVAIVEVTADLSPDTASQLWDVGEVDQHVTYNGSFGKAVMTYQVNKETGQATLVSVRTE